MSGTVVVTLSDSKYFPRARRTIIDVRTRGQWFKDIVLICIEFMPSQNFLDFYNVKPVYAKHVDVSYLLETYKTNPIRQTSDNRQFDKLAQWNKFYVFSEYYSNWNKVIYLDAGLRVFDTIKHLEDLDCTGAILAPDDGGPLTNTGFRFGNIIDTDANTKASRLLMEEYPESIFEERYFLNCIWMYDTSLLNGNALLEELISTMNKYPICPCNEMTIMNLIFTFKYKVWKRLIFI